MMEYNIVGYGSIGWIKDFLAFCAFMIALCVHVFFPIPNDIVVYALVCSTIIDGAFTIFPTMHCMPFHWSNVSTRFLVICVLAFMSLFVWWVVRFTKQNKNENNNKNLS